MRLLVATLVIAVLAGAGPARARTGGGATDGVPPELLGVLPPGARPAEAAQSVDAQRLAFTVNERLEKRVRALLERGRVALGHVILVDTSDGRVLAYVSTDPERFPATRVYPTASLMKVVTAGAAMRRVPAVTERGCRYEGSPYRLNASWLRPPAHGGRVDSFWRALAISNNQCFARIAVDDVGAESMLDEMARLGLLDAPAPGHEAGVVEPIDSVRDLGELGCGLDGSFITPLAAARLAAVLDDGLLVQPYWIERANAGDGRPLALPHPAPVRVWPAEVADDLRGLLVGTTARGTAKSAFRDRRGRPLLGEIEVAGKTGRLSGHDPDGRYEWFIGVAPADAPRVALATVVVNGDRWWTSASEVAALVLREVFCPDGACSRTPVLP